MSDSLFFFITAIYLLWAAISGVKAKQKRDTNAVKLNQPALKGIDKIALTENASFSFDDIQPAYEPHQVGQHHSYDHSDTSAGSDASENRADLKKLPLAI